MKTQVSADLGVSGSGLAAAFARLGLIDEYRLVVYPVTVGSGKPFFPRLDHEGHLRPRETRTFRCGAVYLRYQKT